MQVLDLRFPAKTNEQSFQSQVENTLLYVGGGSLFAWSAGLSSIIVPLYVAEASRRDDAFRWSIDDSRTGVFVSNFMIMAFSCFLAMLAFLRLIFGWFGRCNWERFFLVHGGIVLLFLPFSSPEFIQSSASDTLLEVEGTTEAFRVLLQFMIVHQCLVMPFRCCYSWVLVACILASSSVASTFAPPMSNQAQMVILGTYISQSLTCWMSAWRIEKRLRLSWALRTAYSFDSSSSCSLVGWPSSPPSTQTLVEPTVSHTSSVSFIPGHISEDSDGYSNHSSTPASSLTPVQCRIVSKNSLSDVASSSHLVTMDSLDSQSSLSCVDKSSTRMLTADSLESHVSPSIEPRCDGETLTLESLFPILTSTSVRSTIGNTIGVSGHDRASHHERKSCVEQHSYCERITFKSSGCNSFIGSDSSFALSPCTAPSFRSVGFSIPSARSVNDASVQVDMVADDLGNRQHQVEVAVQTVTSKFKDQCVETCVVWEEEGFNCKCCSKPPKLPGHVEFKSRSPRRHKTVPSLTGRPRRSDISGNDANNSSVRTFPTSSQGLHDSLALFFRRWSLRFNPEVCCSFHQAAQLCCDIASDFLAEACDDNFECLKGWQCSECGLLCPKAAPRCSPCWHKLKHARA